MNDFALTMEMKQKILSIGAKLNSEQSLESLLYEVQNEICGFMHAEAASVFLYNEEEDCMQFLSLTGEVRELIKSIKVPMNSVAGLTFLEGSGRIVNDIPASLDHFKLPDARSGFHTRNILAFPLETETRIGVIEIVNLIEADVLRLNPIHSVGFSHTDLEILELFSKMISYKIANEYEELRIKRQMKAIIESISGAIDLRDQYTHQHSKNVAELCVQIGKKLGLEDERMRDLEISGLLHDIGKIAIEDKILLKPAGLTKEEYALIQKHPDIGKQMLGHSSIIDQEILQGISEHHEKLDGTGYPNGLKHQEIHLFGRIIAVADIYDALIHKRVYKLESGKKEAMDILFSMCPEKLDKKVVTILKEIVQ